MPAKPIDITDRRFGRLTVLSRHGSQNGNTTWLCICDCGNEKIVSAHHLKAGSVSSCGCLQKEHAKKQQKINFYKHGKSKERVFRIWQHIKSRRLNKKFEQYADYGGRGITVCERWMSFENFLSDMGEPSDEGLSIDRIDVNGNYEPGNCRWANRHTQSRNTTRNIYVKTPLGVMCCMDAASYFGVPYYMLRYWINQNKDIDICVRGYLERKSK